MMDERSVVEEVTYHFLAEQRRLKRELSEKQEKYSKSVISFSELPFVPLWKNPLKPFFKWRIPRKIEQLKKEIPELRQKIEEFAKAIVDLEQGIYHSAIPLFNSTADRFYRPSPPGGSVSFFARHNQKFFYIFDLKKQLISLHEAKA